MWCSMDPSFSNGFTYANCISMRQESWCSKTQPHEVSIPSWLPVTQPLHCQCQHSTFSLQYATYHIFSETPDQIQISDDNSSHLNIHQENQHHTIQAATTSLTGLVDISAATCIICVPSIGENKLLHILCLMAATAIPQDSPSRLHMAILLGLFVHI